MRFFSSISVAPIYTTLSLYQDYEWTIRATQTSR